MELQRKPSEKSNSGTGAGRSTTLIVMDRHVSFDLDIADKTKGILPKDDYTYLLGASLFVFERINAFVVENLGYTGLTEECDWYHLIDAAQHSYVDRIRKHIDRELGTDIADRFGRLLNERNRIVHGFVVTDSCEQVLGTKTKHNDKDPVNSDKQHIITREEMQQFIADCMDLETRLGPVRDRLRGND